MKILVVDDDKKISQFIVRGLQQHGFVAESSCNGLEAYGLATVREYDAAVVDIMMPEMDGLTLVKKLREGNINTPVLILSAKRTLSDRVKGLKVGGDDYLVKPFAFSELLARIEALIRRSRGRAEPTQFHLDDLTLDVLSRKVTRAGKTIALQPREFALLECLMRNAGRVASKTMIMENVWGYNFDSRTNVIEARISRLRDKVDRGYPQRLIHTVRGVGYVVRMDS